MRFDYRQATTVSDAVASTARHTSQAGVAGVDFIAGGTDLIQLLQERVHDSHVLLDISGVSGGRCN